MVPYAGYMMPVQYDGVTAEHINVRENVGVFDVSHMGEFLVKGEHALELIQKITTNDASKLVDGKVQYSCFPNGKGGIVDDLLVYRIDEKTYMLVVNASNMEKDWTWIQMNNTMGAELEDISEKTSLLAVQGPNAAKALQSLTDIDLENMVYYTFEKGKFAGHDNVLVSATGYTGAGGFEIYFRNEQAEDIWNKVMEAGAPWGIKPAGLAARDTLRLEMGFCLYGNEIDETTSPIEAGLGWVSKFTKEFIDSEFLKKQKEEGPKRRLVGFVLEDKGIPRRGYPIMNAEAEEVGVVTSGTMSPSTKLAIGMGYVPASMGQEGTEIFIQVRNKLLKAVVTRPPFYKV